MHKRYLLMVMSLMLGMTGVVVYVSNHHRTDEITTIRQQQPSPAEVLVMLKDGHHRFVNDRRTFPRLHKGRIAETALAQTPFATFLACSDSRVPVENIFDAGIGDLFVVRVAGNVCSDHEIGSIEYGVEHLKTPVVVILGHTHCGAVTAVVDDEDVRGIFPHLAEHILPSYDEAMSIHPDGDRKTLLAAAVKLNGRRAIHDLL